MAPIYGEVSDVAVTVLINNVMIRNGMNVFILPMNTIRSIIDESTKN